MTVSLGIRNRQTSEYKVVPISTNASFDNHWMPLCAKLGLSLIPEMPTAALLSVRESDRDQLISELPLLIAYCNDRKSDSSLAWIGERAQNVLNALLAHPLQDYELDFG